MIRIEHKGKHPVVHPTAYVAPTAVLCGDVTVGEHARVLFGAVLTAEGGPVTLGAHSIVMEHAVLRGTAYHPCRVAEHVLIGPHAHLTGCTVQRDVFVATGASVFNGAVLGAGSEVRIQGVVHLRTRLAPGATVPIGWIAVGDPAELFPPDQHERIWAIQKQLDFPGTVFGLERVPAGQFMPEMTRRYGAALGEHRDDRILPEAAPPGQPAPGQPGTAHPAAEQTGLGHPSSGPKRA
jgi:carbonic anhydrase/acetyltransferase-like protein (isoleucine patch superfamily)